MVGIAITCSLAFCGFMKWMRNDRTLAVLFMVTGVLAIIGISGRMPENPRLNSWDGLVGPFAYVASYASLRYLYKRIYRREPTNNRGGRYDQEEGRRQNWLDVAVHVLPMMIGLSVPIMLTKHLG